MFFVQFLCLKPNGSSLGVGAGEGAAVAARQQPQQLEPWDQHCQRVSHDILPTAWEWESLEQQREPTPN